MLPPMAKKRITESAPISFQPWNGFDFVHSSVIERSPPSAGAFKLEVASGDNQIDLRIR
jgi:hypothetical protein